MPSDAQVVPSDTAAAPGQGDKGTSAPTESLAAEAPVDDSLKAEKSTKKKGSKKSSVKEPVAAELAPAPEPEAPVEVAAPPPPEPVPEPEVKPKKRPSTVPPPEVPPQPVPQAVPEPIVVPAPRANELPINVDPDYNKISRDELNSYKSACDALIKELQDRLSHEEDAAANLAGNKKKLEGDLSSLKKDIEDLELALQKV